MKVSAKDNNQKMSVSIDKKAKRSNRMSKADRKAKKQLRKFEKHNFDVDNIS